MKERELHLAVAKHIRTRGVPGLLWWHTGNEGKRTPAQGVYLKRMGVLAGVADLLFLRGANFYALELKTEHGRLTETQMEFLDAVNREGGYGTAAYGLDMALKTLELWGLLRIPTVTTAGYAKDCATAGHDQAQTRSERFEGGRLRADNLSK